MCFAIIESCLKNLNVFGKDASQSNCSQNWGYTIPRASMIPWARNLISTSLLELSIALVKPHTHHGVTYPRKQQMKNLKN
jgi:hypothetical protein